MGIALPSVLLFSGCHSDSQAPAPPDAPPAQIMRDFELTDMNQGQKAMTLKAIEARLFDDTHKAELEMPDASFFKAGKPTSRLQAPKGRVDTNTHEVQAWGGVLVVTTSSETLTTEHLQYDPAKRIIKTEAPVRLERPDSITEGIGLESDPELDKVSIGRQKVKLK
jgi:LPS export ABC transporter protein LptC